MNDHTQPLLSARNLNVSRGNESVFTDLNFDVKPGETVAILGRSGEGKTTLLYTIAGLLKPDSGDIYFNGKSVKNFTSKEQREFRINSVGFVMQFSELIPELTLLENVMVPSLLIGDNRAQARNNALKLLSEMEISPATASRKPHEVSGGQQQRTAIARALLRNPPLLLADEPTGALDRDTADIVSNLLFSRVEERKTALITVTHDRVLAEKMNRVLHIERGKIYE
ncbi:ABC transporter ATP-binding protein [Corynebacterium sp. sy039]|uniref:ABC transporter ATP-binding protein n=1 Tax=Corynebacterium sp. sy039 TaxID=2599641 RepID=UPI0011B7CE0F|nr:ABC transporter ATP-binding protein [Corynebacterium sp. sy039]QDZ42463.1 ABC transporter ATP-binding protein [Corynebacterium sp. sy039]